MPFSEGFGRPTLAEVCVLAADVAITGFLCFALKRKYDQIQWIKNCEDFSSISDLVAAMKDKEADEDDIPYGCVSGTVINIDDYSLKGRHGQKGVVRHREKIEHRERRFQGAWIDNSKQLTSDWDTRVMGLCDESTRGYIYGAPTSIAVSMPLNADFLADELEITDDSFTPKETGGVDWFFNLIYGNITTGWSERERMLLEKTRLTAIGRFFINAAKNGITVTKPEDGNKSYILSKMSKGELLTILSERMSKWKVCALIFGGIGIGIAYVIIRRLYLEYKAKLEVAELKRQFAEAAAAPDGEPAAADNNSDAVTCVICLANRRNVMFQQCRHICVCFECWLRLPLPRLCPFCRSDVTAAADILTPIFMP